MLWSSEYWTLKKKKLIRSNSILCHSCGEQQIKFLFPSFSLFLGPQLLHNLLLLSLLFVCQNSSKVIKFMVTWIAESSGQSEFSSYLMCQEHLIQIITSSSLNTTLWLSLQNISNLPYPKKMSLFHPSPVTYSAYLSLPSQFMGILS